PDQLARFDLDFHLSILDATHNALIEKIGRTVEEMFFASIRSTLAKSSNLEQLIAEHHAIVQAVQQGQTDAIAHVVRQHLSHWGKEVGAIL
ncbi:MAG: FadR family transcriptional regulator, partial [Anaerolineales bacterium]|nr:FadR family transcriptional regulator [Anaerolineales bacterium]